jgi:hypothetical protein
MRLRMWKRYEPEYTESDFGDMIINPNYNQKNQLHNLETN